MIKGRSLHLFFIEGKPDGMLTAEVFNWTGHVLRTPRTQLREALAREQSGFTGIYLLIGEGEKGPCAYIGEGDCIRDRIKSHDAKKDWWETAVLVTSTANNLNKAHARYLEARLISLALNATHHELENGNSPSVPSLSESATSDMEVFLENLLIVLPAIGIDIFKDKKRNINIASEQTSSGIGGETHFILNTPKHNISAKATLKEGEFVVIKGSDARNEWTGANHDTYVALHKKLIESGLLKPNGKLHTFTESYAFSSPTAAAAVINGRSTNGRTAWKIPDNKKTYAEWEQEKLLHEED
jgi:hypothetical protein